MPGSQLAVGGRNFQPSRGFTRDETLAMIPGLNPAQLRGSVRYFDALTNDALIRRTGYSREEIVGGSMRLLHGPDTDPDEVARILALGKLAEGS